MRHLFGIFTLFILVFFSTTIKGQAPEVPRTSTMPGNEIPEFPNAQPVAITNVTVIDVEEGIAKPGLTVVVEGELITAVGPVGEVQVTPADARIIDASGKFLIPGLWDMHTHLLWSTDELESTVSELAEGLDSWTLWKRYYGPTLNLLITNGITGIREMFGNLEITSRVQKELISGERFAPRMIVAGHTIDGFPAPWPGMSVVKTPEEARSVVDSLAASGAAFIKVRNRIRPDEYRAIAKRTHEIGIPLVGHVPWLMRARDVADAGQQSIEHMTGVLKGCSSAEDELIELNRQILEALSEGDDAVADSIDERFFTKLLATQDETRCRSLLRHLAQNETWQTPTLVLKRGPEHYLKPDEMNEEPLLKYIHPTWRISWAPENDPYGQKTAEFYRQRIRWYERKQEIIGMAAEEGVPVLAGTDTPNAFVFPGFSLHEELKLLVEAGMTPLQALQSATLNPARFLNVTDSLGTIEVGKLADLVLLDANPLEDITNTQKIRAVIANGRYFNRAALDKLLAEVEKAAKE